MREAEELPDVACFFAQAIPAPSMKESADRDAIAAAMAKPGVVLKRPVGSDEPFGERVELPKDFGRDERKAAPRHSVRKSKKKSSS